ncbi:chromate transporter [Limnohabitans radicicola]|uniref:Chromate transporter n=1 Tax=Limnohabitans radicicola TaxID=2771427 RepID=A0A927FGI6_9BURK|nr:chromate transporter [Limnohabitans radicicola]MBD8051015.1 chromate transporter [Limnohabitans radicicola]
MLSMPESSPLNHPRSKTDLFISFTLLALQGFGGVLAVVQRVLVEEKRWMTKEQFVEDWAVAQIMPGPNVVNLSLMIGGRYFGLPGALAGLAGMLTAPLIVALLLAMAFGGVSDAAWAQGALRGMGAVSAGLIAAVGLKLISALRSNPMGMPVCVALAFASFIGVGVMRWPLAYVLLGTGTLACGWAYWQLAQQAAQTSTSGDAP